MDAIVDLEHVTGTVLVQSNPIALLVEAGILFLAGIFGAVTSGVPLLILPMWLLSGFCVFLYFLIRTIRLKVAYEGDTIVVPMRACSYASADKFHKQLRNYLDRINHHKSSGSVRK